MTKDEALKLAIESLEAHADIGIKSDKAIAAIKETLAQPAQEPVSWAVIGNGKFGEYELGQVFDDYEATHHYWENRGYKLVPVYTTPQQRPWVGLTDEEINTTWKKWIGTERANKSYTLAIEATLRSKNT